MSVGKLIGNEQPCAEALADMRERGGSWAAFQNHDLGHPQIGHLRFLKYGPGCTYAEPPSRYPDTPDAIGWRYILVGKVNLQTGNIEEA